MTKNKVIEKTKITSSRKYRKKMVYLWLAIIAILGIGLRFWLASGTYNNDILAYTRDAEIFHMHQNLYVQQPNYNYSPFFFYILGFLSSLHNHLIPIVSFAFIVRAFISVIDLISVVVLIKIAQTLKLSLVKTALLFFLNPVSVIISGHHGQFDNLAVLFLLLGVYVFILQREKIFFISKNPLFSLLMIIALISKQIVAFQVLLAFLYSSKYTFKGFGQFLLAVGLFLLTFLPYVKEGMSGIINHVFQYGGLHGLYGVTYILNSFCQNCMIGQIPVVQLYQVIFMVSFVVFVFFIRNQNLPRLMLLSLLFFLTFTSGIGAQYFVLPIALGALFPTKWFYLYSIITTTFLLGSSDELNIPAFQVVSWNSVWIFALLWFSAELVMLVKPLSNVYKQIVYN